MDPAQGRAVMRLSDLRNKTVKTLDGETVGRVHDVHSEGGRIVALACGPRSFIERLTSKNRGRLVQWESVVRATAKEIVVASDPPSASRNPRGTRRPSAPRSKR